MTTEPKIAQTWEECAQHVEAGGVVQWRGGDDKWRVDGVTAIKFLERTGTPGKRGWRPRRLLPFEAPTNEPKLATTWEECAQHVEAGGVVEYLDYQGDDVWMQGGMTAVDYRGMAEAPGKRGWRPRRLLLIEDANPEGMTPGPEVDGRPTWYGTAKYAQVAGMTEARGWTGDGWSYVNRWTSDEIVQARYPLPPKPKTERVHWWEAVGRTDPNGREIVTAQKVAGWKPQVRLVGGGLMDVESPDGTVEVLTEDDES